MSAAGPDGDLAVPGREGHLLLPRDSEADRPAILRPVERALRLTDLDTMPGIHPAGGEP